MKIKLIQFKLMKLRLLILFLFCGVFNIALKAQTVTDPWKTLGSDTAPTYIVFDAYNNMYVSNRKNSTISKITPSGTVTEAWASLATNSNPAGMVIDAAGNLYTVNRAPSMTVSKITPSQDGTSASVIQTWASLGGDEAYTIAIDASGNLYVPYVYKNRVAKIVPSQSGTSGIINTSWATLVTGANPYSISFDAAGNLYTANSNNTISKITPSQDGASGTIIQAWASLASNSGPKFMVFDASENLYVTCWDNSTVSKITPSGNVTAAWATLGSNVWPVGIVCDASGNIFTANHNSSTISKITSDGTVTPSYVSLATNSYPYFLAFDATGNLYVTDMDKSRVSKISYLQTPLVPQVSITSKSSGVICEGTNVTFVAKASGISMPAYQWYKNGSVISSESNATFSTTTLNNNDQISASVSENGTSITSNTITVTLTANNTVSAASSTPTLCINTALTNITHTTTGATGIGTATGLPAGVTAAFASNTITISGTPTIAGSFNYSIPLTGGCSVNATGTITVNPLPALELTRQNSSTNGLNFDRASDYILVNNSDAFKINVGTVEAWIKASNANSSYCGIVAKPDAYSLFLHDNVLMIYDWGSGGIKTTGVNLGDNLWHHIAVSFNSGVNNGTFVYVDGVLKLTTKYTVLNQNSALVIGAGAITGGQGFTGNIDDVRIWNTARTQSQIQAVMNSELLGTELGLVAYYNFNQGIAGGTNTGISTLKDLTSNAKDGNLNGFALTGAVSNWVDGASNGATGSVMVNSTIQLNNATLGGVWSTSDASLATVSSSGLVTGKNAGTVIINYTVSNSNNCSANVATSITVNPLNTSSAASSTPSLCINTALNSITFTTSGATGIATATGLPDGVTAAFASNTITISGTPTVIGTFNYSIPLTGGFGTVNATGTITVNPTLTVNVTVSGDACINKTILTATAGLTSYAWYKDNVLISGATSNSYTPTTAGAYQVQVSNGSCTSTSSSTTIYTCGLTADGRMVPTTNSTTLVSVEGATNNGKGIDERGLIVSKPFSAPTSNVQVSTVLSTTGKVWMDRNLGASQVASSSTDVDSYGDLYQWGRGTDGHEKRVAGTTSTLSSTDVPGNANFIKSNGDWRSSKNDNLWQGVNGVNNPCPTGFRLPTSVEWTAEMTSWSNQNSVGALASPLKLPMGGNRRSSDALLRDVGTFGGYWSNTVSGTNALNLGFDASANMFPLYRGGGFSVRCIQH